MLERNWPVSVVSLLLAISVIGGTHVAEAQQERQLLPNDVVQQRMDSLLEVALTTSDANERLRAITRIAMVGTFSYLAHRENPNSEPPVRYPGVVGRLDQIYSKTSNSGTKDFILRHMPLQSERVEAADFLAQVARSKNSRAETGHIPVQLTAIHALEKMGPVGRTELQRIWATSGVTNPLARRALMKLSENGWKLKHEK